jgi:hypothetical protein
MMAELGEVRWEVGVRLGGEVGGREVEVEVEVEVKGGDQSVCLACFVGDGKRSDSRA